VLPVREEICRALLPGVWDAMLRVEDERKDAADDYVLPDCWDVYPMTDCPNFFTCEAHWGPVDDYYAD